ncbi:MAG: hypothetical protein IKC47_03745 [Clostridia bacterium]|nr:hypothetical protein [Clostridia bacterium]
MKYCTKCNVGVNSQHQNCPLCGSYLARKTDEKYQSYKQIDDKIRHPVVTVKPKINFLQHKFSKLMLAVSVLCLLLDWIATPNGNWAGYVIFASFFVCCCITWPIAVRWKIQRQIRVDLLIVTLLAVAFELYVTRFNFEWLTVTQILPWVYVAGIVLVDFLIIFRRYQDVGLFSTLVYATVFAALPQIAVWIAGAFGIQLEHTLKISIIAIVAVINLIVVLTVCTRSLKEEMDRKLHL